MSTDEEVTNSDTEESTDTGDGAASTTRRSFMGAGATIGAGLLGTFIGRASADSNQAGTYGNESNPGDFYAEDVFLKQQTNLTTPPSGYVNMGAEGTTFKYKLPDGTESTFGGGSSGVSYQYDVTDYGAVGDGSTDDASAIQSAIDAASSAGNGVTDVVFPPGTYGYETQMEPKSNVRLIGLGGATIKQLASSSLSISFFSNSAVENFIVEGLRFDGNRANAGGVRGFVLNGTNTNTQYRDIHVTGFDGAFIDHRGAAGSDTFLVDGYHGDDTLQHIVLNGDTDDVTVRDVVVENGANRPQDIVVVDDNGLVSGATHNTVRVENVQSAAEPTRYSIRVRDAASVRVRDCYVTSVRQYYGTPTTGGTADQISITECDDVVVEGCTVDGSGDVGVTIENDTSGATVRDCVIYDCDGWAISVSVAGGTFIENVDVEGNRCYNNVQLYSGRSIQSNAAITLNDATDCTISGNVCYDDQGTATQDYGVFEKGTSDYNIVTGNVLRDNGTGAFEGTVPTNSIRSDNLT